MKEFAATQAELEAMNKVEEEYGALNINEDRVLPKEYWQRSIARQDGRCFFVLTPNGPKCSLTSEIPSKFNYGQT